MGTSRVLQQERRKQPSLNWKDEGLRAYRFRSVPDADQTSAAIALLVAGPLGAEFRDGKLVARVLKSPGRDPVLYLSPGARAAARLAGVPLPESNDARPFDEAVLESVLDNRHESEASGAHTTAEDPGAPRVMIVEDHYDTALMLADLLGSWGFTARVARTGAEACQIAAELRPRVVLLDLSLPDLHGYRVATQLRANSDQPMSFIVVTGWAQPVDQSLSMAAGISHHLVKPVNPEALRRILEDYRRTT